MVRAARFGKKQRGRAHEIAHLRGVAEHAEAVRVVGREARDLRLELLVLSAHDHGLKRKIQAAQPLHHGRGGAEPERASGDEQQWHRGIQPMARADRPAVDRLLESGVDGNAAHRDAVPWKTERLHVDLIVILRNEIMVERAREPHGMEVIIGHHDRELRLELLAAEKMRDHSRRHEVRADDVVGIEVADEIDERLGLRDVDEQPHVVGRPRVVGALIPPAEKLGHHRGEPLVEAGVELLVEDVRVVKGVIREHLTDHRMHAKGLVQRIGGLQCARNPPRPRGS